jgi:dCMP deaminase
MKRKTAMAAQKKRVDPRPDWDTYFMAIAEVAATRANCSRRKVAAIVVSENRIISTGYNGTPRGVKNCFEGGCPRCAGSAPSGSSLEECICVHAEQNAICQAAYHGIALAGATIYVTISPCLTCAKMIINAGIREVVYGGDYAFTEQTERLLKEAKVTCRRFVKP